MVGDESSGILTWATQASPLRSIYSNIEHIQHLSLAKKDESATIVILSVSEESQASALYSICMIVNP